MTAWEALQDHRLAVYDKAAIEAVGTYIDLARPLPTHGLIDESIHRDYLLLAACEMASSAPLTVRPGGFAQPFTFPIPVGEQAVWIGIAKNNTSWFSCGLPSSLEEASMWDVVTFGGDISKLTAIGVRSPRQLYENAVDIIIQLRDGYASARATLQASPIEGAMIDLLGALWVGKCACIAQEDAGERVTRFLGQIR